MPLFTQLTIRWPRGAGRGAATGAGRRKKQFLSTGSNNLSVSNTSNTTPVNQMALQTTSDLASMQIIEPSKGRSLTVPFWMNFRKTSAWGGSHFQSKKIVTVILRGKNHEFYGKGGAHSNLKSLLKKAQHSFPKRGQRRVQRLFFFLPRIHRNMIINKRP